MGEKGGTAIFYLRHGDYGPTKERQLAALYRYADDSNLTVLKIYEEKSETEGRTVFLEALDYLQRNEVDALLVTSLDRIDLIASSYEKTCQLIADLNRSNTNLISITDNVDSGKSGKELMSALDRAIKHARSSIKGEKVHQSLKTARALGEPVGRPKLRDDKAIMQLRAQGLSIRDIAKRLKISTGSVQSAIKSKGLDLSL